MERNIQAVVVLLILILALWVARAYGASREGFDPYAMQLYDSPRYYPFYEAPEYAGWDVNRRCSAYCGGPGGCTVACR